MDLSPPGLGYDILAADDLLLRSIGETGLNGKKGLHRKSDTPFWGKTKRHSPGERVKT
jgi:hypothetical protein